MINHITTILAAITLALQDYGIKIETFDQGFGAQPGLNYLNTENKLVASICWHDGFNFNADIGLPDRLGGLIRAHGMLYYLK